jgi:FtsZ-binding cell division protein ZapB
MDNKLESDEKRRYAKALLQNEKLKAKYQFEKEVSKELAARNDHLKKEYGAECDKSKFLIGSLDEVTAKFELLFESVGSGEDQFSKVSILAAVVCCLTY